jgi:hypothetical protein
MAAAQYSCYALPSLARPDSQRGRPHWVNHLCYAAQAT